MIDNTFCSTTENVAVVLLFIPVKMDLVLIASSFTCNFTLEMCVCSINSSCNWVNLPAYFPKGLIQFPNSFMFENGFSFNILELHFPLLGTFGHYSSFFWKNISVEKPESGWIPPFPAFFVPGRSHSLQLMLIRACSAFPCKLLLFLVY